VADQSEWDAAGGGATLWVGTGYMSEEVEGDFGPKEAVVMNTKIVRNGVLLVAGVLMAYGSPMLARAAGIAQEAGQAQAAPAQPNGPSRPDLNLTDDQKAQMKKIHQDAKAQIEAVNNDSSLSADQKQAKIQAIHRGTHKQVEAMLTPEQRQKMRAWRQEHRGEKPQDEPPPSN
jgi:Spy/CpxP family protein refolding chaperone